MSFRTNLSTKVTVNGRPYTVFLVDNPTIEDVLVVEMKLRASEIVNNEVKAGYRVARDVRDVLIRLGVDR